MDLLPLLEKHNDEIVDRWIRTLVNDPFSPYSREGETALRPLVNRSACAFRLALCLDDWREHDAFISMIAKKRLGQGFKLSEVQGAFQIYAQTIIPILVAHIDSDKLADALLGLNRCMTRTLAHFSEYFQELHNRVIQKQASFLEIEVTRRTKELAESRQKYKNLVEDIRDGYFVLTDGTVAFANRAFCEMHGYSLEEVLGRSYLDFVASESRAEMRQAYEESRVDPHAQPRLEYLRLHRDGRRIPTEIMAKVSVYEGAPASLGVCRDFSAHAELARQKREAAKLNAVAQVAASLAHDIRNPLTAVKMNVQMLAEGADASATHRRLLETSLREVESIERSVAEMLDLARPFRLEREPVVLAPLLSRCLEVLAPRMRAQGVNAWLRLSRDLPAVRIDRHRMEQAVVNVLFNAAEALPNGGRIFVATRLLRQANRARAEIRISDDGPGIPRELLPYVFDNQKGRSIGLGLANVRKILEAHGGEVTVTRRRPRGMIVRLRLPVEG